MKIEKGMISGSQITFLVIGLLQASTLTASFISGITKTNTWIVLMAGFGITVLLLVIYTALYKKFPHKNLIEMNNLIYGKYLGKVISIIYILYFGYVFSANFIFTADFFDIYVFQDADVRFLIILLALVSTYAVRKGIENIARASFVISVLTIIVSVTITLFVIKDIDLSNFLPLFQIKFKDFVHGINLMISIPFGEIVLFLMIFPCVKDDEHIRKYTFWGLIIGGIYFVIVILRDTAVLGNIASIHVIPSYEVARDINVGEIITRMEVLVSVILLFDEFVKICIMFYVTVLCIAYLFKLRSYKPLVIPVGIIGVVESIIMFNAPIEHWYFAGNIYPIIDIPVIILFPIASLIISSIRKLN